MKRESFTQVIERRAAVKYGLDITQFGVGWSGAISLSEFARHTQHATPLLTAASPRRGVTSSPECYTLRYASITSLTHSSRTSEILSGFRFDYVQQNDLDHLALCNDFDTLYYLYVLRLIDVCVSRRNAV